HVGSLLSHRSTRLSASEGSRRTHTRSSRLLDHRRRRVNQRRIHLSGPTMKCLHCRQAIFRWARRCDHCGATIPKSILYTPPDVSTTVAPDLDTIRGVMPLRYCDCFKDVGETTFHSEIQDTQSEGWTRLLELVEIAAADGREEFAPFHGMTLEAQSQVI